MFKFFFLFIGFIFIAVAVIIKFFPNLLVKIMKILFNKMYGVETDTKQKKQKDITIEKKKKNSQQGYSDYEVIDEKPSKTGKEN